MIVCKGMALDRLSSRERHIALLERYSPLLTENQRQVLGLHLGQDWSLSEIATHQGTSRAAVHDMVRRSVHSLEHYECSLGLLAERDRSRDLRSALARDLAAVRQRVTRLEARLGEMA